MPYSGAACDTIVPADAAVAVRHRLRSRQLYRPPARGRLGQRRAALSQRAIHTRASPNRVISFRSRRASSSAPASSRRQRVDAQDLRQGIRPALAAERDGERSRPWTAGKAEFAESRKQFFEAAATPSTMEGFFADPIYGGNRDKVAVADDRLSRPAGELRQTRRSNIAARSSISSPSPSPTFPEGARPWLPDLKEVDVVTVGVGWTGSILARELTKAGLTVVGLERGANRIAARGFHAFPRIRDEFKYRAALRADAGHRDRRRVTLRHVPGETALPMAALGRVPARATASAAPARIGTASPGASCRAISSCAAHLTDALRRATPFPPT